MRIIYERKSRAIVWRAERCLRPSDMLLSPSSAILRHLTISNKMNNIYHYSVPIEVKNDSMDSSKIPEAL